MVRAAAIKRAPDAQTGFVQDVGVNHGRRHILMAEELLHRANVVPAIEQVRGEAVAEGMTAGSFGQAGFPHGNLNGVLKVFLLNMVAPRFPRPRIKRRFRRRKDILPA